MIGGPTTEDLGRVITAVRRAGSPLQQAEDVTIDIFSRFHTGDGPGWLRGARARTRLDVLTVLTVLEVTR